MQLDLARARIRQSLMSGELPRTAPKRVSGSSGSATKCVCCGLNISEGQLRLTLDDQELKRALRIARGVDTETSMHPECAQIWLHEADSFKPPQEL